MQGVKEARSDWRETDVRLAVVSGLQNAQRIIDRIRAGDAPYDLIEVMPARGASRIGQSGPPNWRATRNTGGGPVPVGSGGAHPDQPDNPWFRPL
jgi:hypothetical protein